MRDGEIQGLPDAGAEGNGGAMTPGRTARLVVSLLNDLMETGAGDLDAVLSRTIERLGREGGFDRTFMFSRRPDRSFFNSHEWVGEGITPAKELLQNIGVGDLPSWSAALKAGKVVLVADTALMPEGSPERALHERLGVRTTLIVPLHDKGRLIAVMGFDAMRAPRPISAEEKDLFAAVARGMATVLSRAQAETALAASRARLAAVLRAVPDLVLEVTADGILSACHAAVVPLPIPDPAPHCGQPIETALPTELAVTLRAMGGGPRGVSTCEVSVRQGDDLFWIEVSGTEIERPEAEGPVSMAFVLRDVTEAHRQSIAVATERRQAQEARDRLTTAIEALPDGFALYDQADRLVAFNSRYVELYAPVADIIRHGARYEDMARAALAFGLYPEAEGREEAFLAGLIARHRQEQVKTELQLKDGRVLLISERATPDGGRVGIRQDVTAQRQSEQRLANVIEGAQVGTWEWDIARGLNRVNDRWFTMLGHSADPERGDLTPSDLQAFVHPEDFPNLKRHLDGTTDQSGERFECLMRMRHVEGHWVWVQSRGRVLRRDPAGQAVLMAGVHLDVSALIEAEQRMERLISGAKVGTWEFDRRTGVNRINDQWAAMLGYRREELEPMDMDRLLAMIHPADRLLMGTSERAAVEESHVGSEFRFDHPMRLRHRDGSYVWIQSRGQVVERDREGRGVVYAGVHLDISQAKALETALQQERDTMARLMETSVSGIIAMDEGGRIVFANREAEKVLGTALPTFQGRGYDSPDWHVTDLDGQPIPAPMMPVARVLATGETVRDFRHLFHRPDGLTRVLSVNAAPLSMPGMQTRVVCSILDITEMIESEAVLRAAMARAEAANRAKSEFLANMSHEIRTPLNGVLGMADLLQSGLGDGDQRQMLQVIRDSGQHLLALINDLLDLSKIESGRLLLEDRPVHPPAIVARVAALHGPTAEAKGVSLRIDIDPAAQGPWRGDARRLTQILHNLLGNAVKFTDAGEVLLAVQSSGTGLEIIVRDSGIGMDPALIDHVFQEFTQAETGTTRLYGGTGLGLPITRRLARLMGGDVAIRTAPGQGLEARVVLPLLRDTAPPMPSGSPLPPPRAGIAALRVLVAEDNATNRLILTSMLRRLNLTATVVVDGEQAVQAFEAAEFDLLLLDISMPRRDGASALAEMRRIAQGKGRDLPPAIAVTANAMDQQVRAYLAAGFARCLAKPLGLDPLAEAIAALVPNP